MRSTLVQLLPQHVTWMLNQVSWRMMLLSSNVRVSSKSKAIEYNKRCAQFKGQTDAMTCVPEWRQGSEPRGRQQHNRKESSTTATAIPSDAPVHFHRIQRNLAVECIQTKNRISKQFKPLYTKYRRRTHSRVKCSKQNAQFYGGRIGKMLRLQTVLLQTWSLDHEYVSQHHMYVSYVMIHVSCIITLTKPYCSFTFSMLSQYPDFAHFPWLF